jgi:uncharacterized protein (TIGR02147 family)
MLDNQMHIGYFNPIITAQSTDEIVSLVIEDNVGKQPDIFSYLDYRQFLGDMFAFMKETNPHFSYRYFSQKAGFASHNSFKLVMQGKRNLTLESTGKIGNGFGLKRQEMDYFENLVKFCQASNNEDKNRFYRRLMSLRKTESDVQRTDKASYEYFSKWYYPAIRELSALGGGRMTPSEIAKMLVPGITHKETERALGLLEELNLISRDDNGTWKLTERAVTISPEVASMVIMNYHRQMIRLADESLERYNKENCSIYALTMSIDSRKIGAFQKRIESFQREIVELCSDESECDQVIQLNLQMFPLSKRAKKGN